ncbi:alpha/beta fold hydrolase [Actinoplanes sp. N902-109]|uniref:alpha/beta fold hydrolase n=1 Tax=Actinoplanes sp. (strain N902-109) TaxID=649831 RepID=UPI0003295D3E|nr:alpha/beta hydrolase [Actinoplanes sp. N902-109]AGL20233.1 hydrolase [Actinoplanes sp. N902-109]
MIHDRLVDAGDLPIAVRDFGGDQPALLLLHGLGGNLAHMTALARALRPAFRVITMDLRGHGRSGDGPWSWDAGLGDIAAVTVQMELTRPPAVVGHSFGGLLAAQWGQRHPETPGVVNLDGYPPPTGAAQLPGLEPDRATAGFDHLMGVLTAGDAARGRAFPTTELPDVIDEQRAAARAAGANEKLWIEAFRRNVVSKDGETSLRPTAETAGALRTLMTTVDLTEVYATTPAPTLAVLATRHPAEHEEFADLYAAHRRFLAEQAATAAKQNPRMHYLSLDDASHSMDREQPQELARVIGDFLGAV